MKICYLTDNIDPSHGGGRYASDLISAVKKAGCDVVVLKAGGNLFLNAARIRKYIKDCDIIHAIDGYPYGVVAALANIGLNKKLVITIQGTYAIAPLYSFGKAALVKWAYKRADKIISISRYTKEEFLKKVRGKEIIIINHGIDFKKFYRMPSYSPENFILSVGALKFRKGYQISILAFAEAKRELPDLKYKIIGSQKDKIYFDELKNLAAQHRVDKDIEFLTGLGDEELSDFYGRAKLFILTSINENHHFEGFGLVFLEAAAAGLPVIGTLDNGIEDAVKNGYNGLLAPQNDVKATAKAIIDMLKDEKLRKEMSLNSITWAKDHDWEKVVVKYIKVYKQLKIDIGCGKNKKEGYVGVDIDPESKADIIASALNLPFENDSVDEVFSRHLIEHFSPDEAEKFFNEIYRVLKIGGKADLKIDCDWSKGRLLKKDPTHKYRYSAKEIKNLVKKFSQFKVKKIFYFANRTIRNKISVHLIK